MEPITLILTALATGTALVAKGTLTAVGKDAYDTLKTRLQHKFTDNPKAEMVLADYLEEPDTWEKPLRKELTKAAADQDQEIMQAAQKLIHLVQPQQAGKGKYVIQMTNVEGVSVGDYNHLTMSFGKNA